MLVKPDLKDYCEVPGDGNSLEHLKDASSLELMKIDAERLPGTDKHKLFQHRGSSWSHNGNWGQRAVRNIKVFWAIVGRNDIHYEDDVFGDFGGNDGTVAEAWRTATGNKCYSIDIDDLKQGWGKNSYPHLDFINAPLENIPLEDNSVDWGFCSHTFEHVANLEKSLSEVTRIVRQALFVVVPLEGDQTFWDHESHMRASNDPLDWLRHFRTDKFKLAAWGKPVSETEEMYAMYVTDDFPEEIKDYNHYYLDKSK